LIIGLDYPRWPSMQCLTGKTTAEAIDHCPGPHFIDPAALGVPA
jgi:hypothetical protein